jgi:hypothetical protein
VSEDGATWRETVLRSTPCGKQGYTRRKLAAAAAAATESRLTGELIGAYHCPRGCHVWHIGHPPGSRGEYVGAPQVDARSA